MLSQVTIAMEVGVTPLTVLPRQFYISLTVHLGITLVNNQPDARFSIYLFISLLYMF